MKKKKFLFGIIFLALALYTIFSLPHSDQSSFLVNVGSTVFTSLAAYFFLSPILDGQKMAQENNKHLQDLIRKMGSRDNGTAISAVEELRHMKAFTDGSLNGRDFSFADLRGAPLYGANLKSAGLRGAHLENASMYGAHLENANLLVANLKSAGLSGAHLENAELAGAILENANLSEANLEGADLTQANLEGAWLYGTNLLNAVLYGAYFMSARFNNTILPDGTVSERDDTPDMSRYISDWG